LNEVVKLLLIFFRFDSEEYREGKVAML